MNNPGEQMGESWFIKASGKIRGPFTSSQLVALKQSGRLTGSDEISTDRSAWRPAAMLPALFGEANAVTPLGPPTIPPGVASIANSQADGDQNGDGDVQCFYSVDGVIHGPAPLSSLRPRAERGELRPTDYVWLAGTSQWVQASTVRQLGFPSSRRSTTQFLKSHTLLAASIACVLVLLLAIPTWYFFGLPKRGPIEAAAAKPTKSKNMKADSRVESKPRHFGRLDSTGRTVLVSDLADDEMNRAVGLVVCGARVSSPLGETTEVPRSTGSCFSVSNGGYLITNRHVVKEVVEFRKRFPKGAAVQGYEIVPMVWVFFGRDEKYAAEIEHVSEDFDMAILKVDATDLPVFRLAAKADLARGTTVHACGFPGVADVPLSEGEAVEDAIREASKHKNVEQEFKDSNFVFSSIEGKTNRPPLKVDGIEWIQHGATVYHGNSGGPLITSEGVVVAINTLKNPYGPDFNASLSVRQLKDELDAHIRDLHWE